VPNVKGKKFPYTAKGKAAAAKYAKKKKKGKASKSKRYA